jgi:hypothetical protein
VKQPNLSESRELKKGLSYISIESVEDDLESSEDDEEQKVPVQFEEKAVALAKKGKGLNILH